MPRHLRGRWRHEEGSGIGLKTVTALQTSSYVASSSTMSPVVPGRLRMILLEGVRACHCISATPVVAAAPVAPAGAIGGGGGGIPGEDIGKPRRAGSARERVARKTPAPLCPGRALLMLSLPGDLLLGFLPRLPMAPNTIQNNITFALGQKIYDFTRSTCNTARSCGQTTSTSPLSSLYATQSGCKAKNERIFTRKQKLRPEGQNPEI